MRQTVPMRRRLTMKTPPLHAACKPMSLTLTPGIHKLALAEPARRERAAHRNQSLLLADAKLDDALLGGDAAGGEVAEGLAREVARVAPAVADLHGPVAVARPRLVAHDLAPVQLQDGAADALGRAAVEERGHALLDRQHARSVRHHGGLAFEGGGSGARGGDGARGDVEAVWLGRRFEDRADCAALRLVEELWSERASQWCW